MSEPIRVDAYRISSWLDTSKLDVAEFPQKYGIEARIAPRKWVHCSSDGKLVLFDQYDAAADELNRLRSSLSPTQKKEG